MWSVKSLLCDLTQSGIPFGTEFCQPRVVSPSAGVPILEHVLARSINGQRWFPHFGAVW
jgi:hypothetical protein